MDSVVEIDLLIFTLEEISLTAGALGTHGWRKLGASLLSMWGMLHPSLLSSYCPAQSHSPVQDLVLLWGDQFLQRLNLLSSTCWPWGSPSFPGIGGEDPRTAFPPLGIAQSSSPTSSRHLVPVIWRDFAGLCRLNQLFIWHLGSCFLLYAAFFGTLLPTCHLQRECLQCELTSHPLLLPLLSSVPL